MIISTGITILIGVFAVLGWIVIGLLLADDAQERLWDMNRGSLPSSIFWWLVLAWPFSYSATRIMMVIRNSKRKS